MKSASDKIRGKKNFLQGNLPASIQYFTTALGLEPDSPEILLGRGAAYLKLGEFERAIDDFSIVLNNDGDSEKAIFLRGIAHLNAGDLDHALADLNRTLEYNENRTAARLAKGFVLSNMGRHAEAKNEFNNSYVLENLIIDEFLEEYAISEVFFNQATARFNAESGRWKLLLTEDEITKIEATQ